MKKIVIIGGGSKSWTPSIIKDMLLTESLKDSLFVLYDIQKEASDLTKAFLETLARQMKLKVRIISTDDKVKAFRGADYFLITISTGGLSSMSHDLSIPEQYGVFHTVGDTSGPGGWARFLRNFSVFEQLAKDIKHYAPEALILNYTNPMTTLTDVLAREFPGKVVGLCHGLFENLNFLVKYFGLKGEHEMAVQYGGLNHFFWITQIRLGKRDLLQELKKTITKKTFGDLDPSAGADPMGYSSTRVLSTEIFRETGVMPYLGDRHTSEFYAPYITNRGLMKKYDLRRTSIAHRKKGYQVAKKNLQRLIAHGITDPESVYLKRSRETAADILGAHVEGKVFIDVGNVPNIGQISNLPMGTVVETPVKVDRNGFSPIAFGDLPKNVVGLVRPYAEVFNLSVEACLTKNKDLALHALRLDPVTSHLPFQKVREMGEKLIQAHRSFLPKWLTKAEN